MHRTLALLTVGLATPALACWPHASRSVVTLFGIPLGFQVHTHACPVVVAAAPLPPPVVVAAPTPPPTIVYVPAPPAAPPPPPPPAAPVPRDAEAPATLGVKYLPGLTGAVSGSGSTVSFVDLQPAHAVGAEVRLSKWLIVRSDYERRASSHSFDVLGLKLALPTRVVAPYVSASLSGTEAFSAPGRFQLGVVAAAGLDVKLGRHFFLEAEVRARPSTSSCCREVPSVSAGIGGGVAFF